MRVLNNFEAVRKLLNDYIIEHIDLWLENSKTDDKVILFIIMDLCDETLETIIDEFDKDSNMKITKL